MRVEFCLPLALLFLSSGLPSNAQKMAPADRELAVEEGAPLLVECALRVEQRAEWRLDGRGVPADLQPAPETAPRDGWLAARLRAPAARAHHAGVYTCAPHDAPHKQRVRVQLRSAPPSAGAETTLPPASAAPEAARGVPDLYFDRSFELNCTNLGAGKDSYSWSKNDTELSKLGELRYELLEGGAVLRVKPAHELDYGNYSCRADSGRERSWRVWGRPHAKLPANTNVVEGQKLKLTCKVIGKPSPEVTWKFRNNSDGAVDVLLGAGAMDGRVSLEDADGVAASVLVLADARRDDAGVYTCEPGAAGVPASTTLRVKDMYAALWPFLGICAEVFVLCAIILVYEKRRTKPELDDSDTDNHEQ